MIPLLTAIYPGKVKQSGDGWTLSAEAGSVVLQVKATSAGTTVLGQRVISVKERLGSELYRVLAGQPQNFWQEVKRLFAPPTCQSLGITDTTWYRIERCRFVPQRPEPNSTPSIEISLRSAVDRTVPLHQTKRFGTSPNPCIMYDFF
ncbi:hypothetical protein [Deinococcus puniceus]|uniref:Uncharacterized protein n=1 Tax=Deinococcus puniceus TaxID=1182568 RepID=A0A172TAV6_9DEIO|nr:hypothetical protein [Deinococcus puniceus]ANE44074.1 hypothetical protein SU48_10140 [Deinococcus puniceus]